MASGRVLHTVAPAVSIKFHRPYFCLVLTMLYLLILDVQWDGTNLTAHIDIQVHQYEEYWKLKHIQK